MKEAFIALFQSRRFWLAIIDSVQIIVLNVLKVDPQIWQAINGIVIALIAGITIEDSAQRISGR